MTTRVVVFTALMSAFGFVLNFFALPVAPSVNIVWGEIPIYLVAVTVGAIPAIIVALIGQSYTIILWGPGAIGQMVMYAILGIALWYLTRVLRLWISVVLVYVIFFYPAMWLWWVTVLGTPDWTMYPTFAKLLPNALLIAIIVEGFANSPRIRRLIPFGERYNPAEYGFIRKKRGQKGQKAVSTTS